MQITAAIITIVTPLAAPGRIPEHRLRSAAEAEEAIDTLAA